MDRMPADFFFDCACLFAQFPSDKREVDLLDCALGKLSGQIPMGRIIFRDNEASACFFIEAMNDAGPFFSADS